MVRYTQEQKEEALKRVQELGVAKASEELHISTQTLYKWRNEILIKIKEDQCLIKRFKIHAALLSDGAGQVSL